ncbi:MAG: TonB-dependent receptor [Blastomonas sp.]
MKKITPISRRTLAAALAAAAIFPSTAAMAGEVVGTVTDLDETTALQAAELRIVELDRIATSARDGSFRFPDVPAGNYTLEVRYVGAPDVSIAVNVSDDGVATVPVKMGVAGSSEILVIGQAANQASALSRQRAADGVSSVLTRDAVGQFPDQNVAESLRRLSGVNILNDQGEGRFVSVRGLDPNLNSSSVNGVRLPSPESDVRSVALDVISSDLIESIEVKKSLTPDMDGDTIGASVEINTVSAFDRKKDLLTIKAEGSYNEFRDSVSPKASLDFSTRLSDDFGIAGGISYYRRKFESDNVEADGWDVAGNGVGYVEELEYRDYDVTRERISASLSLDLRASDTTTLYARGLYSQFDDQEYRRRLTLIFDEEPESGDANSAQFTDDDGRIEVRRDIKDRFESQKIKSLVLGGDTETGPWKLSYSGSWAKSSEYEADSIDPARFRARFDGDGVDVNLDYSNDMIPLYSITSGAALFTDPSEYSFNRIERSFPSNSQDEEYALRADLSHTSFMDGGEFTIQGGVKSRWRKKSYDFDLEFYGDYDGDFTLADVLGTQTYRITDISPVPSYTGATEFFRANFGDFELDPIESDFGSAVEDYSVDEDILAGYLLGRWDSNTLRIIGGVRVERTSDDISGNLVELIEEGAPNGDDLVRVTPNRFQNDYTDWLPSITFRYEPQPNVVLRLAGYKSLVRPNLGDLAPRFVVEEADDGEREGEFGNPALRPYKAWNFDASAEYYFSTNAAISAGFFYKDVKNFIVDFNDENPGTFNGIAYDEAVIPINGDSAEVYGFEFSYSQALTFLPEPLDGLLIQFNYTYTNATGLLNDGREIDLPTSSRNTFNAVLGYEKGPFSFRLAGTYRDKYLDEIGGDATEDRIVADHFGLDASIKFDVTKNVQLFGEVINITDEPYFAYQARDNRRRLLQYEEYGITAKFGVKVKL